MKKSNLKNGIIVSLVIVVLCLLVLLFLALNDTINLGYIFYN